MARVGWQRVLLLTLSIALGLGRPGAALGQRKARPAPADADARRKFEQAQAQYGLTRFVEAGQLYAEAYRMRPARTALLLYAGDAYKKDWEARRSMDSLGKAIEFFQRYLDLAAPGADLSRASRELGLLRPQLIEQERQARTRRLESAQGAAAIELVGRLLGERDTDGAERVLARARSEPGHSRAELTALYRLEGQLAARKGETARATAAWRAVLALEPGFSLPATEEASSSAAFGAASRASAGQRALVAQHVPAGAIRRGDPALVRVQIDSDPVDMIRIAAVSFRARGGSAFAEARYPKGERMALPLPADFVSTLEAGAHVEYYLRLLGERDAVLFEFGGPDAPFSFAVREKEAPPARPPVLVAAPTEAPSGGWLRAAGWSSLAGGGALLTLGVVTSAWGRSLEGDLDKACPPPDRICATEAARADNGRYEALRTFWRVGFVAGGVGAAAGALLLFLAPEPATRAKVRLAPFVGWGAGGVVGTF